MEAFIEYNRIDFCLGFYSLFKYSSRGTPRRSNYIQAKALLLVGL